MTSEDKLIKLYETAVKELYREIAYKDWYGNSTGYQRALLDKVKATLKKLKRKTPGAVREALEQAYATGLTSFCKDTDTAFTPRVNWRQLDIMIQNAVDQLTIATNRVGRIWQDAIRRAGVEATKHKMATGQTVDQMRRQLAVELYHIDPKGKNGKTGIATKRGTMSIVPYAALVARSTTAEAQNAAKINAAGQHGYDLARFTSHAPKCAVCAQYEGRVYALTKEAANGKYKGTSGEPLRFPYLYDTAFASGYNNIHPNCRHRLTIIVPALCTPEQLTEWSRQSMRPFADTRGDRERKAYAAAQAKNRARWQDRRQWEKYRALLPDQTPANFGAFRVMKQSESQRWKDLQADYRYVAKTVKRDIILTDDEQAAVLSYVSAGSYVLNAKLREGVPLTPQENSMAASLDSALQKLPKYKGEVIRSLKFYTDEELDRFSANCAEYCATRKQMLCKAFTSASVKSGYHERPSVLMYIDSKQGRDLREYNSAEAEILFPRGTRFAIDRVWFEDDGTVCVKARDVTDEFNI